MKFRIILSALFAMSNIVLAEPATGGGEQVSAIVVVGAGGTPEYTNQFLDWGEKWKAAGALASARTTMLGVNPAELNVRERLQKALASEPTTGPAELWLVLLGHGTWDGQLGKFNVEEDDISSADLVEWLAPIKRPIVIVAAFSTSGSFLKPLAGPGRVVVSATRSGSEENYSRFGDYFSTAIADPAADINKDGEVSLLEAWITGARGVATFYQGEGRIATEHALLDDNGDGLGTPADWFEGVRVIKKPKSGAAVDGARAAQIHLVRSAAENALPAETRARRDALELEVAKLRDAKSTYKEADYYQQLERLLLELARLYEAS